MLQYVGAIRANETKRNYGYYEAAHHNIYVRLRELGLFLVQIFSKAVNGNPKIDFQFIAYYYNMVHIIDELCN